MGIHRENLVIPLGPKTPGTVRRKPNGKFEIVVDASGDFDEWLKGQPPIEDMPAPADAVHAGAETTDGVST